MKRSQLFLLLSGLVLLIAPGCSRKYPLSTDPKIATREVNAAVPLGTSESRARNTFSARGFTFSELATEASAGRLIIGTYTTPATLWQVGFIIVDGKVAARTVAVTDLRHEK
jgi:hypothetical protein